MRHGGLPRQPQRRDQPRRRLRRADGARRADAGRDAAAPDRVLPRQRVAAGQPAAAVRPRGPVRLRLSRAAQLRRRTSSSTWTGRRGPSQDFTDLHAWAEVYVPGAGWVGMDPTSSLFAGEGHIPLSATPHPSSAAPIEGATEPVEVDLLLPQRGHPDPRGPARDPALHRRGLGPDRRARRGGRRTTGRRRRPADHGRRADVRRRATTRTSDEWNTDADGEGKRALANQLADRLRQTYAAGGIVHRGQGKWYPGRAAAALEHRAPVAHRRRPALARRRLFADPWDDAGGRPARPPAKAEALARRITQVLGLPEEQLWPAYEDPFAAVAAAVGRPGGRRAPTTSVPDVADSRCRA